MPRSPDSLTPKREAFCQEYLKDSDGAKAAIRAGYSERSAKEIASEILTFPNVQARIEALKREKLDENIFTARQTLEELTLLASTDISNYITVDEGGAIKVKTFAEMPPGASRAIRKIKEKRTIKKSPGDSPDMILESTIEFELWDKPKALDLLGQHHTLFQPKKAGEDSGDNAKALQDIAKALQERDG